MYYTFRHFYPHGGRIEENHKITKKEFETFEKALAYAHRYAKGERFLWVDIRNDKQQLVYCIHKSGKIDDYREQIADAEKPKERPAELPADMAWYGGNHEDFDPYVYDENMEVEDYEKVHKHMAKNTKETNKKKECRRKVKVQKINNGKLAAYKKKISSMSFAELLAEWDTVTRGQKKKRKEVGKEIRPEKLEKLAGKPIWDVLQMRWRVIAEHRIACDKILITFTDAVDEVEYRTDRFFAGVTKKGLHAIEFEEIKNIINNPVWDKKKARWRVVRGYSQIDGTFNILFTDKYDFIEFSENRFFA